MNSPENLLLPLLVLWPLLGLIPAGTGPNARTLDHLHRGGWAVLAAFALLLSGDADGLWFDGPRWLTLFPGIEFSFLLWVDPPTAWMLLLLTLASLCGAPVTDRRPAAGPQWVQDLAHKAPRAMFWTAAALTLAADDLCLWMAAWAAVAVLLVRFAAGNVPDQRQPGPPARRLWIGMRLASLIPLSICGWLLVWELRVSSWSGFFDWLESTDELTPDQSGILVLAALAAATTAVLHLGLFPGNSLWPETDRPGSPELLVGQSLLPGFLLWLVAPLTVAGGMTPIIISLAMVTFVLSSLAAIAQEEPRRIVRTLFLAHLGLAAVGLSRDSDLQQTAGLVHLAATAAGALVWQAAVEHRGALSAVSRGLIGVAVFVTLSGLSGAHALLGAANELGPQMGLVLFVAWFVLCLVSVRTCLTLLVTSPADGGRRQPALAEAAGGLLLANALFPVLTSSFLETIRLDAPGFVGLPPSALWAQPEYFVALVLAVATVWVQRSAGITFGSEAPLVQSLRTVLRRQFHLTDIGTALLLLPLGFLATCADAWERGTLGRILQRYLPPRPSSSAPAEAEPLVWDAVRGGVCVACLLVLFLWWYR